uniref:C3H1-type domain-containing protein n=1 Tax=Neobodo designis TaxID=312471 RepID=A0A7S1L9A2_NEODS|mmetsp:Transcript_16088/g.49863  ORF Transcript_16088/g.49863 Transcript_16088/m.49863 type:complete len:339 (+) Transcript_16088:256-1272(+)|eukprot:CAMPEP_0174843952 /NCGR_PEP_ID=MMETSP1114-20130205/10828_1 /TAXON_ID=312471 /ORGANISM="Neobodo designis, Strain CCAP 1951/1" /LENGTH=338 /DNA_ID=CAMNT_0016078185 /DNA_START=252 /DNA_END=1268 /DNA_ORIENTATION=+
MRPPSTPSMNASDKRHRGDADGRESTLRVRLSSRPDTVLLLPLSSVSHVPTPARKRSGHGAVKFTLCPACEGPDPAAECARGTSCPFVHAAIAGAPEFQPHERGAAQRGEYERFEPGTTAALMYPSGGIIAVPSETLLRTRAHVGVRRVLSVCEHFATKGRCDRGAVCSFAHPLTPSPGSAGAAPRSPPEAATGPCEYHQHHHTPNPSSVGAQQVLAASPPAVVVSGGGAVASLRPADHLSVLMQQLGQGHGPAAVDPSPSAHAVLLACHGTHPRQHRNTRTGETLPPPSPPSALGGSGCGAAGAHGSDEQRHGPTVNQRRVRHYPYDAQPRCDDPAS